MVANVDGWPPGRALGLGRLLPAPNHENSKAAAPGADPLLNFAEALARTLADFGKIEAHGVIRDRLFDGWSSAGGEKGDITRSGHAALKAALEFEGTRLRVAAGRPNATILISVDQA